MANKKYTIEQIRRAFMLGHPVSTFREDAKRMDHWTKLKDALVSGDEQ